jgi:hypothetical protein
MPTHLVRDMPWGNIDINTNTGFVFFQQKWQYDWSLWPNVTAAWTYSEKLAFHTHVDRAIWSSWSNRVFLGVMGQSDFAKKFSNRFLQINFDVAWQTSGSAHWAVRAWKMPPGAGPTSPHRSFVRFGTRQLELNTADIRPRGAKNDAGIVGRNFYTPPHEFGHMIGAPDEYGKLKTNPFLPDSGSMMNVGRGIRGRHMSLVLKELGVMLPGTYFYVLAIR